MADADGRSFLTAANVARQIGRLRWYIRRVFAVASCDTAGVSGNRLEARQTILHPPCRDVSCRIIFTGFELRRALSAGRCRRVERSETLQVKGA